MPEPDEDRELAAIQQVIGALTPLDPEARTRVIQYVFQRLGITGAPGAFREVSGIPGRSESPPGTPPPPSSPPRQVDIRTFREEKNPRSANEMAALVAYYLAELAPPLDRKADVSAADIERYFKQANFRLPAAARFTLTNAKNAGYFDAGSQRGSYRLNAVGHNLVAHTLPAAVSSSAGSGSSRAPRKRVTPRRTSSRSRSSSRPKARAKR